MDLSMVEMQEARSKQTNMDLSMEHPNKESQEMDLREKASKGM